MTWEVHSLGALDLLWSNPTTSTYFVEDIGDPPEEEADEGYVTLNDGAGARLGHYALGKAPLVLWVWGLGSTQAQADEARDAIQDEIDLAISGTVVTYTYQEAAGASLKSWRIIGGRSQEKWRDSQGQQVFGLNGRFVAIARVSLNLSRG